LHDERIDLLVETEKRKGPGLGVAVVVSLICHVLLVIWFIRSYHPAPAASTVPISRYVELIKQDPRQFAEAPGQKVDKAPINAPLSDANRRAATPNPTGPEPTKRPGDGKGMFSPSSGAPQQRPPQQQRQPAQQQQQQAQRPSPQMQSQPMSAPPPQNVDDSRLVYRQMREQQQQANATPPTSQVDWQNAIREVSRVAALGGADGLDLGQLGGEKGSAEQGPLSFESSWYDWGPYAASMVGKIRVNWYANMPQIIRTGIHGFVTIRFTIQHDGRITDVTILKSSDIPPYDYAAKKAIELSSPLAPLPKDFPKPSERVTCIFYYNMDIPQG
jgi:TonB family protein